MRCYSAVFQVAGQSLVEKNDVFPLRVSLSQAHLSSFWMNPRAVCRAQKCFFALTHVPTGLDSYNAFNVVDCLVTLARNYNRTVIFTIHQPRSNIVALFDQLILLAQGKLVYSGALAQCQTYFERIGHPCPPGFNIGDYLSKLAAQLSLEIFSRTDIENSRLDHAIRQCGNHASDDFSSFKLGS